MGAAFLEKRPRAELCISKIAPGSYPVPQKRPRAAVNTVYTETKA